MVAGNHRQRFERDGYLVLPGFVPVAECAALRARMAELVEPSTRTRSGPSEGLVPLEAPEGTLIVLQGLLPIAAGPTAPPARATYVPCT